MLHRAQITIFSCRTFVSSRRHCFYFHVSLFHLFFIFYFLLILFLFDDWCLLNGHSYINKPAAVCLSMYDLLVDTRRQRVKLYTQCLPCLTHAGPILLQWRNCFIDLYKNTHEWNNSVYYDNSKTTAVFIYIIFIWKVDRSEIYLITMCVYI